MIKNHIKPNWHNPTADEFCLPVEASRRQSGAFTLVEVMVCSFIFVLFAVFFLNAAISSIRSQQLACDYYKAMTLARNRIQRAKEFEYNSILLMSENQVPVDGEGNLDPAGLFKRTTLVSVVTNGAPNLLKITVKVYYTGALRITSAKPAEVSTLLTDRM